MMNNSVEGKKMVVRLTGRGSKAAETVVKKVWYECYIDGVPGSKSEEPTVKKAGAKETEETESDRRKREVREYEEGETEMRCVDETGRVVAYRTVRNKDYFRKFREERMTEKYFYRTNNGWNVFREKSLADRKHTAVRRTKKMAA